MKRRISGFTLIELLIVVAIIAILAAIAIPNLLEAQTRSKVTRVKADERSLATGIEAFAVENNEYPPSFNLANISDLNSIVLPFETRLNLLTTPVSFITSQPKEPFNSRAGWLLYEGWDVWNQKKPPLDRATRNCLYLYIGLPSDAIAENFMPLLLAAVPPLIPPIPLPALGVADGRIIAGRHWYLASPGPDTFFLFDQLVGGGPGGGQTALAAAVGEIAACSVERAGGVYDPTNGTVSRGEIVRTGEGILANKR